MIAIGIQSSGPTDQNNISKVITVYPSNLSGNGTLEEQIAEYVNTLNYNKTEIDSDIWIDYIYEVATPINAVLSEWDEWSQCSVQGFQTRTRDIITPASEGGKTAVLNENRACTYLPINNKVGAILSFINDVMLYEVHEEVVKRQFTCGAYDGVELMYQRPGETEFTLAYFNGTLNTSNLIYYDFTSGTLLKLTDTIGDLDDSDVFTITDITEVQRTLITGAYIDPCGNLAEVWLDTETNYYYATKTGNDLYAGYFYTYINQVGSEYMWYINYIENGVKIESYSGETSSACSPIRYGGGNDDGTHSLQSAPYGGCSVTYYDANNNLTQQNIPAQDEGLSFSITVGTGGIISDSCGFL